MTVELYGSVRSRAARCALALVELGVEFRHVPLKPWPGSQDREDLLSLNPNGHIPVLVHDDLILWESMAINLYLGDTFPGVLTPSSPTERALSSQWCIWQQTEIDRADWNWARRNGDASAIRDAIKATIATLSILDRHLDTRMFMLGDQISLVDISLAGALSQPNEAGLIGWQKIEPASQGLFALQRWLDACRGRPSWQIVAEMA